MGFATLVILVGGLASITGSVTLLVAWRWWLDFNRAVIDKADDVSALAHTPQIADSFFRPLARQLKLRRTASTTPRSRPRRRVRSAGDPPDMT